MGAYATVTAEQTAGAGFSSTRVIERFGDLEIFGSDSSGTIVLLRSESAACPLPSTLSASEASKIFVAIWRSREKSLRSGEIAKSSFPISDASFSQRRRFRLELSIARDRCAPFPRLDLPLQNIPSGRVAAVVPRDCYLRNRERGEIS